MYPHLLLHATDYPAGTTVSALCAALASRGLRLVIHRGRLAAKRAGGAS